MYSPELSFAPSIRKAAARALPRYRSFRLQRNRQGTTALVCRPLSGATQDVQSVLGCLPHAFAFGYDNTGRAASTKREEREDIAPNWHGIMRMPVI
jgi:hypothetical protein